MDHLGLPPQPGRREKQPISFSHDPGYLTQLPHPHPKISSEGPLPEVSLLFPFPTLYSQIPASGRNGISTYGGQKAGPEETLQKQTNHGEARPGRREESAPGLGRFQFPCPGPGARPGKKRGLRGPIAAGLAGEGGGAPGDTPSWDFPQDIPGESNSPRSLGTRFGGGNGD